MPEIKSIAENIEKVRKCYAEITERETKKIEDNYRIAATLEGVGFDLGLSKWWGGTYISLKVNGPEELRKVRQALDSPLVLSHTEVAGDARKRLVDLHFSVKNCPGIEITMRKKLPKNAKCKIVCSTYTERRRSLVCPS